VSERRVCGNCRESGSGRGHGKPDRVRESPARWPSGFTRGQGLALRVPLGNQLVVAIAGFEGAVLAQVEVPAIEPDHSLARMVSSIRPFKESAWMMTDRRIFDPYSSVYGQLTSEASPRFLAASG